MDNLIGHILVVDDDEGIRSLVKKYLNENNYLVTTADSAEDASEKIKIIKFDLIILDIMMPGKNGLEFIQENKKKLETPIILLTAKGDAKERVEGLEVGADDYLPKPFEPKELILRIQNILDKTKRNNQKRLIEFENIKIDLNKQLIFKNEVEYKINNTDINKVCLSGLNAIYLAAQMINAGDAEVVVAGGMESMTNAPYLLPKARGGYRYGNAELLDVIQNDGLYCALEKELMGEGTERYTATADIDRNAQDLVASESHRRASEGIASGAFRDEIIPIQIPQRRGDPVLFENDEGVRSSTDLESLGKLRPAFTESGNITAGNASQISDGGSAVIIVSKAFAEKHGMDPLAELISYGQVAGPDTSLLTQPSRAILNALERSEIDLDDIDLFEINEAFAAVSVASVMDLGIPDEIVNVNGGAIALGHPIGMSGNRLALTLSYELKRRGGGIGAAALCGGGGQGDALILRVPKL